MRVRHSHHKTIAFGDWQTPSVLAEQVIRLVNKVIESPAAIVEPTCGEGNFLAAATAQWPGKPAYGWEINSEYISRVTHRINQASIKEADFFMVPWDQVFSSLSAPILVVGNPPWVTSSDLGALESANLPTKMNFKKHSGLDALTGKSNFDVSEWMILRLIEALQGHLFHMAMLCKASVARRILSHTASYRIPVEASVYSLDAKTHFDASVDAVLLNVWPAPAPCYRWPWYATLSDEQPASFVGFAHGTLTPNIEAFEKTRHLEGSCTLEWRSGLKHDCSSVMELNIANKKIISQVEGEVTLEPEYVFPLLKGSDVVHDRPPTRMVIVPQRQLGDDTTQISRTAPQIWAYLERNRAALSARKSSIYKGQPDFAVFGVGKYTFAPYKIAIAGLYKTLHFRLLTPYQGQPVILDDTCYFLPFDSIEEAQDALHALISLEATQFFHARIFWDDKRPINKGILQSLNLDRLCQRPRQSQVEARQLSMFGP